MDSHTDHPNILYSWVLWSCQVYSLANCNFLQTFIAKLLSWVLSHIKCITKWKVNITQWKSNTIYFFLNKVKFSQGLCSEERNQPFILGKLTSCHNSWEGRPVDCLLWSLILMMMDGKLFRKRRVNSVASCVDCCVLWVYWQGSEVFLFVFDKKKTRKKHHFTSQNMGLRVYCCLDCLIWQFDHGDRVPSDPFNLKSAPLFCWLWVNGSMCTTLQNCW